ncbi:alkene reductase [Aquabacterium sp. A7-Y]|uniref:alkene reductase n=1 Tax=Aquabacterium sp. A7-Y TaxID=1349605 RepID=UPI00223C951F|nr:alkene reductase [Aquabacterium sp. A7-Y]MCW7536819.1 alkene reductase [Aquabacterium sp. A7-Y]
MGTPTERFLADALFQPISLGKLELANRMVMAPMTRNRADEGNVPAEMTIEYYAQRASVGLIIAEATQVSETAQGYANTPGLHTPAQIAGWKKVTDEVHRRGGRIFVQLWHTGRMSHVSFQPNGQAPVAPSAIAANAKTYLAGEGFVDTSAPRELETTEIAGVVNDFRLAAANAIKAGFDGVEIHGAHGYLIDAFLRDGSNHRSDPYGGSIENRSRFLLEVMQAVIAEIGAERSAIRISPVSPVNDSSESHPQPLFEHVVRELEKLHPVFIHVVEGHTGGPRDNAPFDYEALRRLYSGIWMVNNGYTKEMAVEAITSGRADMVSFGRPFITNPDLPRRFRKNAPLNAPFKDASLYGGVGPHGYIDYPALSDSEG